MNPARYGPVGPRPVVMSSVLNRSWMYGTRHADPWARGGPAADSKNVAAGWAACCADLRARGDEFCFDS